MGIAEPSHETISASGKGIDRKAGRFGLIGGRHKIAANRALKKGAKP
jgi:hypothetical protein